MLVDTVVAEHSAEGPHQHGGLVRGTKFQHVTESFEFRRVVTGLTDEGGVGGGAARADGECRACTVAHLSPFATQLSGQRIGQDQFGSLGESGGLGQQVGTKRLEQVLETERSLPQLLACDSQRFGEEFQIAANLCGGLLAVLSAKFVRFTMSFKQRVLLRHAVCLGSEIPYPYRLPA